jgi:hypothetical protein
MSCHAMHPIQDLFLESFHMYYNLIRILYALLCGQNFILVKSGCYSDYTQQDLSTVIKRPPLDMQWL